jgi:acyl carrier protein
MTRRQLENEQIQAEIRSHLSAAFGDGHGRIDGDTRLVSSGLVDSAGVMQLVLFLEKRFGVAIDDSDVRLENFDTLQALAQLVQQRSRDS